MQPSHKIKDKGHAYYETQSLSCTVETMQFHGVILHGSRFRRIHGILANFRTVPVSIPREPICYSDRDPYGQEKNPESGAQLGQGPATEFSDRKKLAAGFGHFFRFRNFDGIFSYPNQFHAVNIDFPSNFRNLKKKMPKSLAGPVPVAIWAHGGSNPGLCESWLKSREIGEIGNRAG